jgi:hypothetical protein
MTNLKPLTTDGSIMGPADKVCMCVIHWNHDDCIEECDHEPNAA